MLAQNQLNQQQPQGRHGQPQTASYSDFAGTHPPTFAKAEDLLEADSWLHLMESKFELLTCTETQKTLFAAHQLRGATTSWWATFLAMQLDINSHGLSSGQPLERTISPQVS